MMTDILEKLLEAVRAGKLPRVRELLAGGLDPNLGRLEDGWTATHEAAKAGRVEALEELLRAGGDPNARRADGVTPLLVAADVDDPDVARCLLEAGADPRAVGGRERATALHVAALRGGLTFIDLLLDHGGADLLEVQDRSGLSPLHVAVIGSHPDAVRRLLDRGAPPNSRDWNRLTPLHYAEDPEVARVLLGRGADLEASDRIGNTPLQQAAGWGRARVVEVLVLSGADLRARNRIGLTPRDLALKQGHQGVARTLEVLEGGKDGRAVM